MPPAIRRAVVAARSRALVLACVLAAAIASQPGLAESTPASMYAGSTTARTGSSNALDITSGVPHLSWTNSSGGPVNRQRVQVLSSPTTNVVAHWRLDGNGTDVSGNGRDLTMPGGGADPSFVASQPGFGQAAAFDGIDDYLTRPADGAFDMANGWTVEASSTTTRPADQPTTE